MSAWRRRHRVCIVTGVDVIIAALAAGAAAGSTDVAKSAIADAYIELKSQLRRRLNGWARAQEALEAAEADPDQWQTILGDDLAESGADVDEQVISTARRLLRLAESDEARASRYRVSVDHAKGVQVGDHNTQTNTFN